MSAGADTAVFDSLVREAVPKRDADLGRGVATYAVAVLESLGELAGSAPVDSAYIVALNWDSDRRRLTAVVGVYVNGSTGAAVDRRHLALPEVRNRVNKGMQETLMAEPESFLAFNNGLALTATEVDRELRGGELRLRLIEGLQIVNGGQTTASLHHAKYRRGLDLSAVLVQAKLSVIDEDAAREHADDIVRYANSQSPVRMADLASSSPFLVEMERLARLEDFSYGGRHPARPWLLERVRGQFAALVAADAQQADQMRVRYPTARRFDNVTLARAELAWMQQPEAVGSGGERAFAAVMTEIGKRGGVPDEDYFRRAAARLILWNEIAREVAKLELGGYNLPVAAFTLSFISHRTSQRLDLDQVAITQAVGEVWNTAVRELAPKIRRTLIESAGERNVSTWMKARASWEGVKAMSLQAPDALMEASPDSTRQVVASYGASVDLTRGTGETEATSRIVQFGAEAWFALAKWAKETDNLASWQRGIAFNTGKFLKQGRLPTAKMVAQAVRIL